MLMIEISIIIIIFIVVILMLIHILFLLTIVSHIWTPLMILEIFILGVSSLHIISVLLILMMRIHWVPILIHRSRLIVIHSNHNLSCSNHRWVMPHSKSILLSFLCFEINEAISSMSSMVLLTWIFSREVPFKNFSTVSELVNNLVCSHFKIDIMNPDFITIAIKPLI